MNIIDEEVDEVKETKKRNPKNFEEGFTMIENRILTQGWLLTSDAKVAYLATKSFMNQKTGLCYPSYDKIMERSGLTRPRLANALAELEEFGWLRKVKRFSGSTYYSFGTPVVHDLGDSGEVVGLAPDQTSPSPQRAKEWRERSKRQRRRRSWSITIKREGKRIESEEARWTGDEIPF